ncbi:MAG: aspartate-semialdehyde dehydrogenase [candidate division WOR-3 bacterium]
MRIAIVGATGLVGRKMLEVLEERLWKENPEIIPLASEKSAGKTLHFLNKTIKVLPLEYEIPEVDYALFSAGSEISKKFAPLFVERGAVVIDNSSAFRLDERVPLVVPEVNPEDIKNHKGIISNPNCSTIQMVAFLKPLLDAFGIEEVFVATYQSVSGAGMKGLMALNEEERGGIYDDTPFPTRIYRNVIPQIGDFFEGYSTEEWKMIKETKKILKSDIKVYPTTVRVPVEVGHSEAITVILKSSPSIEDVYEVLERAKGLKVLRDGYSTPIDVEDKDYVVVSRLRFNPDNSRALSAWVVADNLRKGAATNAVQILELLIKGGLE